MLLGDCQKLSQQVQDVVALKKYATDLDKFRDRQQKLTALVGELKPVVMALKAFREQNLINVDLTQKVDQVLTEVVMVISEFQQDRGWIVEQFKFKSLHNKVRSLKTEIEDQLRQAWTVYKSQRIPMTSSDLLGLLAKINTFKPTVQTIQRHIAAINTVEYPQDAAHFQRIDQAIQDLSTAWNNLDEVPSDVQNFLRAATTHGASIDLLTSEVKNWLTERGITRFFYIQLTG
jgi:hypothetical protein